MVYSRTNAILICFIITLTIFPESVLAQYEGSTIDPGIPLLSKDVMNRYQKVLDLSDGENQIFQSVLNAQQQEYDRLYKQLQSLGKSDTKLAMKLYPDNAFSNSAGKELQGPEADAIKAKRKDILHRRQQLADRIIELKKSVLTDLRAILPTDKQKAWDVLIRDSRRRQTIIRQAFFIGEPVDLVYVVNEAGLSSPDMDQLMEQYAEEMDKPLQERNQIEEKSTRKHVQMMETGGYEYREWHARYIRLMSNAKTQAERNAISDRLSREGLEQQLEQKRPEKRAHKLVRDINLRYMDMIRMKLTPQQDAKFMALYRKYAYRSYPIFYPLEADRYIEGLINDKTINEKTRNEIIRIRDENYLPQRDQLNLALASAYERWELRWEQRILGTLDPAYENRIKQLHNQRRTLQQQTIKDITPLLSEETLKKHPTPESIKDKPSLNHR